MKLLHSIVCYLLLLTLFSTPVLSEEHAHDSVSSTFVSTQVKPGIHFLQGKGGNVLLSTGKDGLLLIDNDYKEMSSALSDALGKFGGKEKLKVVINTHWHGDHTGNNVMLGDTAQIISHDNVRVRLSSAQEVKLFEMKTEPMDEAGLPDLTYSKRMTLYFNAHDLEIAHFPKSHTDGDSIIFFNDLNLVHMGDIFFNEMYPFIDIENGGNLTHYTESVAAVLKRIDEETVVVPGHGKLSNKAELKSFHEMLLGTTAEVQKMIAEGLSKEKAQKKGLSSKWEAWGKGFLSESIWIGIVFDSVA